MPCSVLTGLHEFTFFSITASPIARKCDEFCAQSFSIRLVTRNCVQLSDLYDCRSMSCAVSARSGHRIRHFHFSLPWASRRHFAYNLTYVHCLPNSWVKRNMILIKNYIGTSLCMSRITVTAWAEHEHTIKVMPIFQIMTSLTSLINTIKRHSSKPKGPCFYCPIYG